MLDAVRIYATCADPFTLAEILHDSDEAIRDTGADGNWETVTDWSGFFYRHNLALDVSISIGPTDGKDSVAIGCAPLSDKDLGEFAQAEPDFYVGDERWGLETTAWGSSRKFRPRDIAIPPRVTPRVNRMAFLGPDFGCIKFGPNVPDNAAIERYLNDVALTELEDEAIAALNI